MKNSSFVYKMVLVCFDEKIGWFFINKNLNKVVFNSKESCKKYIDMGM